VSSYSHNDLTVFVGPTLGARPTVPIFADALVPFTDHARRRCAQRGIPHGAVLLACEHGHLVRTAGGSFYFLGRREVESARRLGADRRLLDRCRGLVVLLADDGSIITAYRNRGALVDIRRKRRFDRRPEAKRAQP
jgi:hypothetical protein